MIKWGTLKTADDLEQERIDQAAEAVRRERDHLLAATDYFMLPDAPEPPDGIAEYRQALREVPEQPGFPHDVDWPKIPE